MSKVTVVLTSASLSLTAPAHHAAHPCIEGNQPLAPVLRAVSCFNWAHRAPAGSFTLLKLDPFDNIPYTV